MVLTNTLRELIEECKMHETQGQRNYCGIYYI